MEFRLQDCAAVCSHEAALLPVVPPAAGSWKSAAVGLPAGPHGDGSAADSRSVLEFKIYSLHFTPHTVLLFLCFLYLSLLLCLPRLSTDHYDLQVEGHMTNGGSRRVEEASLW